MIIMLQNGTIFEFYLSYNIIIFFSFVKNKFP